MAKRIYQAVFHKFTAFFMPGRHPNSGIRKKTIML